jgi:Protein of unknown function (DUF2752)
VTEGWRDRVLVASPLVAATALLAKPPTGGPTVCPFALVTGMACPGCGMTRAMGYLIRGDLPAAIRYHPLAPLVLLLGLGGWIWFMLRRSGKVGPMPHRVVNLTLISFAVLLVAVWAVRWYLGALPPV